jgi:hypothetical protein
MKETSLSTPLNFPVFSQDAALPDLPTEMLQLLDIDGLREAVKIISKIKQQETDTSGENCMGSEKDETNEN